MVSKGRLNPAHECARLAAADAAYRLGWSIQHFIPDRADDAPEQQRLILAAISSRPDAILLAPIESPSLPAALRQAAQAGIALAYFISKPEVTPDYSCFVGADDTAVGALITRAAADHIGLGRIVLMEGYPSAPTNRFRKQGAMAVLKQAEGIRLLACLNGAYQRQHAFDAMSAFLAQGKRADAVVAFNDVMALGVIDACRAHGMACIVTGANAIPEALDAIRDGSLLATASFDPAQMAARAVNELAAQALARICSRNKDIFLAVDLVTADNLELWRQSAASLFQAPCFSLKTPNR